jgi:hypothetical protein
LIGYGTFNAPPCFVSETLSVSIEGLELCERVDNSNNLRVAIYFVKFFGSLNRIEMFSQMILSREVHFFFYQISIIFI